MEKDEITYYEYLDKIIHKLFIGIERQVPQEDLYKEFVSKEFEKLPDGIISGSNIFEVDYNKAINYLESLGLIVESQNNIGLTYKLTFLGLIKHSRKFADEYKTEQSEKKMKEALSRVQLVLSKWQKLGIGAAIIFGIGGLIFGTIQTLAKKCSCNEVNYYIHKSAKYCNDYQCVDVPTIGNIIKDSTDTIKKISHTTESLR